MENVHPGLLPTGQYWPQLILAAAGHTARICQGTEALRTLANLGNQIPETSQRHYSALVLDVHHMSVQTLKGFHIQKIKCQALLLRGS